MKTTMERLRDGIRIFEADCVKKNIEVSNNLIKWSVKSSSGDTFYTVMPDEDSPLQWTCTCKDFIHRGVICKHIYAVMAWNYSYVNIYRFKNVELDIPIIKDTAHLEAYPLAKNDAAINDRLEYQEKLIDKLLDIISNFTN